MKVVQYFTDDYLRHTKNLSPTEIARFLEDFRLLHAARYKLESISHETKLKELVRERLGYEEKMGEDT